MRVVYGVNSRYETVWYWPDNLIKPENVLLVFILSIAFQGFHQWFWHI